MRLTPERRIELADPDKWTVQDSLDALETIDALTAELASAREREQGGTMSRKPKCDICGGTGYVPDNDCDMGCTDCQKKCEACHGRSGEDVLARTT